MGKNAMKFLAIAVVTASLLICNHSFAQGTSPSKGKHFPSSQTVLRAYVAAWNRHDFAALKSLMAPAGFHEDASSLNSRAIGPAQTENLLREMIMLEPDFDWHLTAIVESGPIAMAEWTWTGTYTGESPDGPVVNRPISGRGATVAVIKNGKIQRLTDYYDPASYFLKKTEQAK